MTDKSFINNYQEKELQDYCSNAILRELQNFIDREDDLLKLENTFKKKNTLLQFLLDNRWYVISLGLFILCIFFIPIIIKLENPGKTLTYVLYFARILVLMFILILLDIYFKWARKKYLEIRTKAIYRASQYKLDKYYKLILYLGKNFYKSELNREEIRFRAIVNQRKNQNNFSKTINPYLAIFIVVVSIGILGFPSNSEKIDLLYGAVVGVSGIVIFVKNILDVYLEFLYQDLGIYEQCVLILQEAQKIAAEREAEEDADDIYAYDRSVAANDEAIPFEQATFEIENNVG